MSEVQAALEQLNSLPASLVTDRLRASVLDAAAAAASHRQHAAKVAEASAAANVAGTSGDVATASLAASELAGLALVGRHLPSAQLDAVAVAEALDHARQVVRVAASSIPVLPEVNYTAESAAWWSTAGLPPNRVAGPPHPRDDDEAAQRALDALARDRASIMSSVDTMDRATGDVLALLTTCAELLQALEQHAVRAADVARQVLAANRARRASGREWPTPDPYTSPAIEHLKNLRAEMALEVAIT